jgi:hypothetical protein
MSEGLKVEAARPRGFADRDGADIAAAEAMMARIREVYSLYGFEAVETPFVEYTQALGKFLPDFDRPNEGVFSFQEDDEQWLSLRRLLAMWRSITSGCRSRTAAIAPAGCSATKSRDRGGSASSCSSTPTRLDRPPRRRMPRFA